jgi:ATP-binding cassette subfamily C protein
MQDNKFIIRSFGQFFKYRPVKLVLLFIVTTVQSLCQGITIVLIIPLLGLLDPGQSSSNSFVRFLDNIINKTGINTSLEIILAFFVICLLFVAVLGYYQSVLQSYYQQEFSYEIRKRLFKKIIYCDWEFLNGKSKHRHIQVITTEVPKMAIYYHYYLALTSKILFAVTHIWLACMISVRFTLMVVATGFLVFFLLRRYLKKAEILGSANVQTFRKMLKKIDDFWVTVKIAKVHSSEQFYYRKFDESNRQMLEYQNKQVRNRAIPQLLFSVASVIVLVGFVYMAYSVVHLPLGSLLVLILLFTRIFPQFMGLNSDLNMMLANTSSVKMVLQMDKEIKEIPQEEENITGEIVFRDKLELKGINFSYDGRNPVLRDVSECIKAGTITGVVGKSGCGKTTLIDIIAGLLKSDEGLILVDGEVLTNEKLPLWKKEIGYLPQDSFFIDGKIRDNLIWDAGERPDDKHLYEILKIVNAEDLVKKQKQGLDSYIVNYQYHFSGGERQRLALARVLLRNPSLLLLDEATSSLDFENEAQIMKCLSDLKKRVTIIFVTHRENLRPYFDKIISLG